MAEAVGAHNIEGTILCHGHEFIVNYGFDVGCLTTLQPSNPPVLLEIMTSRCTGVESAILGFFK